MPGETDVLNALLAERERRQRATRGAESSRFDWYGPSCRCPEWIEADDWCPLHARARSNQRLPPGDWTYWGSVCGRGNGKTRSGAEWVRHLVESAPAGGLRIALVAPTAADARDVMIEGQSGLMAVCPDWNQPVYKPSQRRVIWPNGSLAVAYSADEPDRLRGPQHHYAWCDELASWRLPIAFDMMMLGLRLGSRPRCFFSTTPKPHNWLKRIFKQPQTVITRGSTLENRRNLAASFVDKIITKYEGTRLGRQEIEGELLEDVEGALWHLSLLDELRYVRHEESPEWVRVAVSIDPSVADPNVSPDDDTSECGITVGALGDDGRGYLFDDLSLKAPPIEWARVAVAAYHRHQADILVAEVNNGGAMVEAVIRSVDPTVNFKELHASRGKQTRAEPVAALYEQKKVYHCGVFAELENQMCSWVPGMKSPDRMDSLVWLMTELMLEGVPISWGEHPFAGYRG